MSQGGHSESLLLIALFYQNTPLCLKVIGWGGVNPSAFGLLFGTLDFGLGLDNKISRVYFDLTLKYVSPLMTKWSLSSNLGNILFK